VSEQAAYDAWGNLTAITDARGHTTTFGYDPQGVYRIWERNALGYTTSYEYYGINESDPGQGRGPVGALKRVVDPNGAATAYTYDPFGRLRTVVRPGDSWAFPTEEWLYYDGVDRPFTDRWPLLIVHLVRGTPGVSWCSGGLAAWERRFYDSLGRLVEVQTPGPGWNCSSGGQEVVRYTRYDALGRVAEESMPYFVPQYVYSTTPDGKVVTPYRNPDLSQPRTRTTYDALGRVAQVTGPDGSLTRKAYQGGRELVLDPNGHQTEYERDGLGRLVAVREYYGTYSQPTWNPAETLAETRYWYDAAGNLIAVRDALGNVTRIQYDPLGRKTAMDDPSMGHWEYRYDAAGNLVKQRDARGQALCFYYDALNRLVGKTYHSGVVDLDGLVCPGGPYAVSYAYDQGANGIGRRTGMTDTTGVTVWQYDARGSGADGNADACRHRDVCHRLGV